MKITAQDEYGIRILLRIARADAEEGMSIAQLSEAEGLSGSYVAKMTRALRLGGFISSTRGQKGGYVLAQVAEEIRMNEVLKAMDGAIFDNSFCKNHSGQQRICTNSVDCSVRSLWRTIQLALDRLLEQITLADLLGSETQTGNILQDIVDANTFQGQTVNG
jgi:Rrf2 family iron-sulfur cluster assembly transcriptional regulator